MTRRPNKRRKRKAAAPRPRLEPVPSEDDLLVFPTNADGAFKLALSISRHAMEHLDKGQAIIDTFTTAGERSGRGLAAAFAEFMPNESLRQYAMAVQPPWRGECEAYDWMCEIPNARLVRTQWINGPDGYEYALHLLVQVGPKQVSVMIPPIAAGTTVVVPSAEVPLEDCLIVSPECSLRPVPPATVLAEVRSACERSKAETEFTSYPVLPWLAKLIRSEIDRAWETPVA